MALGPETNGLATAALTVGVLSIPTFCLPVLGPIAVVLGFAALHRASMLGPNNPGRRMAIAGIVCGLAGCAIFAATHLLNL